MARTASFGEVIHNMIVVGKERNSTIATKVHTELE